MDFREVDSPFFDKEGKGSSDAEPEADGLRSRVPDQVYIGELDEVKNDCLFSMIVDTRVGGEARNDRRLLVNLVQAGVGETKSSTPAWEAFSRRQRVNQREGLTLTG